MRRFASLRRQTEFARLRRQGRRVSTKTLTLYRSDAYPTDARSVAGITVGSSIGKAVVRNTVRRRLAAVLHDALEGRMPMRLLVIARPAAAQAPFEVLRADLTSALAAT